VEQLRTYLETAPDDKRLFTWVHLFAPHEPYEEHPEFAFGERDLDRYDSEVRFADQTVGNLVAAFRARPSTREASSASATGWVWW